MTKYELEQILQGSPEGIALAKKMIDTPHAHHHTVPKAIPCVIVGGENGITGSRRERCLTCQTYVWLAPQTQRMMEGRTAKTEILCGDCARSRIERERSEKHDPSKH